MELIWWCIQGFFLSNHPTEHFPSSYSPQTLRKSTCTTRGLRKPQIAHCNVFSNNVLVKEYFTLCFCDFGCGFVAQSCDTRAELNLHEQVVVEGELHCQAPEAQCFRFVYHSKFRLRRTRTGTGRNKNVQNVIFKRGVQIVSSTSFVVCCVTCYI